MATKDMTLTSVKIQSELFEDFKVECVRRKFSFQKLSERAIHLYLTEEEFRKQVHNQLLLHPLMLTRACLCENNHLLQMPTNPNIAQLPYQECLSHLLSNFSNSVL